MNSNSQGLQVLVSRPRRHSSVGKINLGDTIHGLTGPVPYSQNKSRQKDLTVPEPQGKNGNYKDSIKKVVTSYSDLRSEHIWLPILWIVLPIYCHTSSQTKVPQGIYSICSSRKYRIKSMIPICMERVSKICVLCSTICWFSLSYVNSSWICSFVPLP